MKKALAILAGITLSLNIQSILADDCQLEITGNDSMQFNVTEMSVPNTCKEVTVTLTHIGNLPKAAMGHNWVLTKTDDMQAVANDGIGAGLDNHYIKADDPRVLAFTEVIGGGEVAAVTFSLDGLSTDGKYSFICSFPGHSALMKGVFNVTM